MTEERLAEIECTFGEYVKAKELIAEVRRCWAEIDALEVELKKRMEAAGETPRFSGYQKRVEPPEV